MKVVQNPENPFVSEHRDLLATPQQVRVEVYEEQARSILSRNESLDLPFRWSVNPYRGCFHACAYCYARPSHEFWGFGSGSDFESKLVVKPNAAEQLRAAFLKPSWQGELVVFSGNTDCYQPLEATYQISRACLGVCAEFRNPVGIITKSALIVRDMDYIQALHTDAWVQVYLSIPFANNDTARKVEPQAPSITKRLETLEQLSRAGIPTGVSIAPVIPGLNEHDIPLILKMARDAGATTATYILLRLSDNVESVFLQRMTEAFPDRINKIKGHLQAMRGGKLTEKAFFKRHEGEGPTWRVVEQLFEMAYRKVGFPPAKEEHIPRTFSRPGPVQASLW